MTEEPDRPELDRREPGTHLPPEAYRRAIGRAKVPNGAYLPDEPLLRLLLNGLRRWADDH
jgi:hypothetical protein